MKRIILLLICIILLFISCKKNVKFNSINESADNFIISNIEDQNIENTIQEYRSELFYKNNSGEPEVIDLIKLNIEFETFCKNYINEFNWENINIEFTLYYEGSDVPPADMLFLSNSIMVLKWYSYPTVVVQEGFRFFQYLLNNNELNLKSIDSRHNTSRWMIAEKYHFEHNSSIGKILSIDEINNIVTYDFSKNRIYYGGFGFYK